LIFACFETAQVANGQLDFSDLHLCGCLIPVLDAFGFLFFALLPLLVHFKFLYPRDHYLFAAWDELFT